MEYFRGNVRARGAWVCRHSVRTGMAGLNLVGDVDAQGGGIVGKRDYSRTGIPSQYFHPRLSGLNGG